MAILRSVETPDWVWFETGLSYDNARLSQALIVTGMATGELDQVEAGLRTLRWLMTLQTAPAGFFRPIGSDTFGKHRMPPAALDLADLSGGGNLGVPGSLARRQRGRMAHRCDTRFCLVHRPQRFVFAACGHRDWKLSRWAPSGPSEREPWR